MREEQGERQTGGKELERMEGGRGEKEGRRKKGKEGGGREEKAEWRQESRQA